MMSATARIAELGVDLPHVAQPVGSYVQARIHGGQIIVTGQLAFVDGSIAHPGLLGGGVSVDEGAVAARICALNSIAAAADVAGGLDKIEGVLHLTGYLACVDGFTGHSAVLNGASDIFVEIFGESGRHARTNVGVASLPLRSPVELQVTYAMTQGE